MSSEEDSAESGDAPAGEVVSYPTVEEMDALLTDYQITKIIGQGGMGVVYRAWQERLERYVAIKVLPKVDDDDEEFAEQFKREAKTMAALHHSHIATVYDFGVVEGLHYLVMEHVDGDNLFQHFHDGAYSPSEVISIVLQVCDGLSYAHSSNVNHRDIKSANILIGQDGMSKLVDFGLATLQEAPGVLRKRSTSGTNYGTPGYSAPELFSFGSHVDHRADVYSMAVVVYEGLTGKTMDQTWVSPSAESGAPAGIDQVIRKATKKDPKARYQSIDLFANALRNLKESGRAAAAPATRQVNVVTPAAGTKPARVVAAKKQSAGPMIAVFAIIAVAGVLAMMLLSGGGDPDPVAKSDPKDILSTVGDEKAPVATPPVSPVDTLPEIAPETEPDMPVEIPEGNAVMPATVIQAEAAVESELAEFDEMFSDAYKKLAEKYLVALDRLRADAPVAGLAAIEAEAASVTAGNPPPRRDADGLYPPLAKIRPVLRTEYAKLVLPIAKARVEVLEPHVENLRAIRGQLTNGGEIALVDPVVRAREEQLARQVELAESPESGGSDIDAAAAAGAAAPKPQVTFGMFKHEKDGALTLGPRGGSLGIFCGLHGESSKETATVFVPPAGRGEGNWELVRGGGGPYLAGRAVLYDNPIFDFSKASFETYEWGRGSPKKRLIDADRGFAMISGVSGRIGASTSFSITNDSKVDDWFCDGRASNQTTKVIVTIVNVPGNLWLKVIPRHHAWSVGQSKVKMIHKDEGFCVLTKIRGPFNGGGESVKLWIDDNDGFWYLSGASEVGGVGATATAFIFPKD